MGRFRRLKSGPASQQPGYWKRTARLTEQIEWLMAMFAQDCPGYFDDIVLLDSRWSAGARSIRREPLISHRFIGLQQQVPAIALSPQS